MNLYQAKFLTTENQIDLENQEADLIELICARNEKAFEQLYHRIYNRLFRFVARTTRRPELIEEIINDVMYVVWEKAHTYNRQCQLSTWIFGIAFNKTRQLLRSRSLTDVESIDDLDSESYDLAHFDAGPSIIESENWLDAACSFLTVEQRTVIELTYYHELHYSEIAEIMGCSENTVKTRMHYARKKLVHHFNNQSGPAIDP